MHNKKLLVVVTPKGKIYLVIFAFIILITVLINALIFAHFNKGPSDFDNKTTDPVTGMFQSK